MRKTSATEVKKNMQREMKQALGNKIKNEVVDELLASSEFPAPKALVDQEIDRLRQDAVQRFGGQMKPEQMPAELFQDQAERRVRTGLLFQELVRQNDLKVDADSVNAKIEEIASTYEQPEEVVQFYQANPEQRSQIESVVLEDMVVDFVLDKAKVKEKKVKYEEAVKPAQPKQKANAEDAGETAEENSD